jgi:hypothetical protein
MIEITSDYGRIGSFHWMNTNQECWFEVHLPTSDNRIRTFPVWWGCHWFGNPPQWLIDHLEFVTSRSWT